MKLYEIDAEILRLTDQITVDEETGEILCDLDAITAQIGELQMERKSVLTYLAKLVLNLRAEQTALKTEEQRLKDRRQRLEKKELRLMEILDRECAGEKTDLGVATVSYRRTAKLNVTDNGATVAWLQKNHEEFIRYPEPEISKNDVKKLIAAGAEVPGVELVNDLSCSLK